MSWLVFVAYLSMSLVCFVCAVLLFYCTVFVFGVYVLFVVRCGAVWCVIGVSWCCVVLFSFFVFWYGVNTFPVCDCMLCVPCLRCAFLCV